MNFEVLYFADCPTYKAAERSLRAVIAEEGIEAAVELVAVNTHEEARRLTFPGSPTIRLDGHDLFPLGERQDWRMGCRIYSTSNGLRGSPTAEMLRQAIAKKADTSAERNL